MQGERGKASPAPFSFLGGVNMNKIFINLLLFSTIVFGSIALLTFDAWADTSTTDVYEIPDDYVSENSYIQFYNDSSVSGTSKSFSSVIYDFDVYVPQSYQWALFCYNYAPYSWNDIFTSILIYSGDGYGFLTFEDTSSSRFYVDCNNVTKKSVTINDKTIDVYLKNNGCIKRIVKKSLKKDDVSQNTSTTDYVSLSSLADKQLYYSSIRYDIAFNQPIIYSLYHGFNINKGSRYYVYQNSELKVIPSDVTQNYYSSYDYDGSSSLDFVSSLFSDIDKIKKQQSMTSFPSPELKSARFNSDINLIQLMYVRNSDCLPDIVENYTKVYVKLQGEKEWRTLDNSVQGDRIVSVAHNSQFKVISGGLNIDNLNSALGYDETDEAAILPVIEGVIWGLRYGYKTTGGSYKYTSYVFNRYVFEDNVIADTDITIDDLGNLTDIKPGNSGSDISVKPGGSANNPTISATDEADYSDLGSFIKSINFDFSDIGKAISGSFSLVTGFASMIGNVFQNFFGEAVGIIALLAIGVCVVLRVLGR